MFSTLLFKLSLPLLACYLVIEGLCWRRHQRKPRNHQGEDER